MRIRFSEGTANIQDMIKELQCVERYLAEIAEKGNQTFYIKSADLYIRIYNEDDTLIDIADKTTILKLLNLDINLIRPQKMSN